MAKMTGNYSHNNGYSVDRALMKELKAWKTSSLRYPILLRGARQVGKTYLVEQFAAEEFESLVTVNFEAQPEAIACFESLDPSEILIRLETALKKPIKPGKTLLFLDEIQACHRAIASMRYFKEKMPQLHLIGAGSLLEFALIQGKFSFPVGRVQFLHLKPLSFEEFAKARGKQLPNIQQCSLKDPPSAETHREMLQLVREYFLIGGMPAAVAHFCTSHSMLECSRIHDILLGTYRADFSKYATEAKQKYLRLLFDGIPQTIGQQFKYSKIDAHIRSRELKNGLDLLQWAGLIQLIQASSASGIPLSAQLRRHQFKILFLDIGLVQRALEIDSQIIYHQDLTQINAGAMAEQFVGQELLAYSDPHRSDSLYYWQREKSGSDAEIDYVFTFEHKIYPIEVKAGKQGKLKSLQQFMAEKKSPLGICISERPLAFEQSIMYVPFYLICQLPRLLKELPF